MVSVNLQRLLAQLCVGLLASPAVNGSPIEPRGVINHDAVVGFAEKVPGGNLGDLYQRFKPLLFVRNGCVPFPAVDSDGNTGGGLNPTGGSSSGCDNSTGQVYVRSLSYGNRYATMYSWYMPKDSPATELGHRHDWEGVVVWTNTSSSTDILAVATSAHGNFDVTVMPNVPLNGSRPQIEYSSTFPVNHQLGITSTKGGEQPLIAWESMTDAARNALNTTDFGSAIVPFKDSTFTANLQKASF
ncbi:NPP1-domain-containing protein [Coleophoma cylindrospora]|uniref:NPP1-domain-containing protein n=1 Tax=Coleophoma cylindrospora TaxID=1849047 RepID=A0A3D8RUN9_9HELO|nr:NPP1-domain-containing protein [Coleophoma cylindrospora]